MSIALPGATTFGAVTRESVLLAAEALGLPQLNELLHGLHEDLLAEFLGLGVVVQPAQRDRIDRSLVADHQLAERLAITPPGPMPTRVPSASLSWKARTCSW